jgi:hypothetical protein
MLPETSIFCWDEATAHSHHSKQTDLSQVRTFPCEKKEKIYLESDVQYQMDYKPDMLSQITSTVRQELELKVELTLGLVQFERMKNRSSRHHSEPVYQRIAHFQGRDGGRLSRLKSQ